MIGIADIVILRSPETVVQNEQLEIWYSLGTVSWQTIKFSRKTDKIRLFFLQNIY